MPDERPALTAVLDHYGVQYHPNKQSQMVRCPLQDEDRTPSMSINLNTELWNCHACGKGGDSYTLIMEKEGVSFRDAKRLAKRLGLEVGGRDEGERIGSAYAGRRRKPGQKDQRKVGGYVPAWRRRS